MTIKASSVPQQVIPLAIIFAAGITGLLVIRHFLVPDTFGEHGHYRADAVDEIAALPVSYAGYQACVDCHDDIFTAKQSSFHKGLSCETCHGPAGQHVEDQDKFKPAKPHGREFCILCHGYNVSRPSGFPQILPNMHNPGKACVGCHDPHKPTTPRPPGDCSACHAGIANQKAVSHHTDLQCNTCHEVPKDHITQPRLSRAEKPTSRDICGKCHGKDATGGIEEAPRIDMASHGGRYMCWDCHYPHDPEATK
ncbi:MAG: hypothetical protein HY851_08300 [candidate division Zixibacteria bacterium]|nr:hypothetical protein [candidate division Zixibacteria bacterium]